MSDCIMVGCDLHDRSMLLKWALGKEPSKKLTFANTPERRRRMIELLHDKAEVLGVERIAARRYGVADIRDFYRNDVRFLEQFG